MNALFYALITEERLNLLSMLLANSSAMSVQSLVGYSALHQSIVRYHLDVLYDAGLLTITQVGKTLTYDVRHRDQVKVLLAVATAICSK